MTAGEVGALVEGALGRRAVAEVDDRARALAFQLLPPGEAGRVRDVGPDRDADRRDVVVRRVPPAGRMAAPPGEHGRRRHPAQQPDRRLAVAREDPVVVLERVYRAGLHRLVVPVDRVRADAALPVVDDRPLVVGAQEHHAAVELDQVVVGEPLDLAVWHRFAVADDAPEVAFSRENLGHRRNLPGERNCFVQPMRNDSIGTRHVSLRPRIPIAMIWLCAALLGAAVTQVEMSRSRRSGTAECSASRSRETLGSIDPALVRPEPVSGSRRHLRAADELSRQPAPEGFRLVPEVAIRVPARLEQRQDVHVYAPRRELPLQQRTAG